MADAARGSRAVEVSGLLLYSSLAARSHMSKAGAAAGRESRRPSGPLRTHMACDSRAQASSTLVASWTVQSLHAFSAWPRANDRTLECASLCQRV